MKLKSTEHIGVYEKEKKKKTKRKMESLKMLKFLSSTKHQAIVVFGDRMQCKWCEDVDFRFSFHFSCVCMSANHDYGMININLGDK